MLGSWVMGDEIMDGIMDGIVDDGITIGQWKRCLQQSSHLRLFATSLRQIDKISNIFWLEKVMLQIGTLK